MSMSSSEVYKAINTISRFLSTTKWNRSYNIENKKLFHSRGKRVMKVIAELLGFNTEFYPTPYEIRSCLGGIAVSGEIILHSENLYICFYEDRIMFRSCKGLKDYSGGNNHWMSYDSLRNIYRACEEFRSVMGIKIG
jgi:hypothetical protein